MLKRCYVCKQYKESTAFYKASKAQDGLQGRCKICSIKTAITHYNQNKNDFKLRAQSLFSKLYQWMNNIKEQYGCCFCKLSDWRCLDFHHIDASTKLNSVSALIRCKSRVKAAEEINKCVVICANCHRLVHYCKLIIDKVWKCNIEIPPKQKVGRKANNTR